MSVDPQQSILRLKGVGPRLQSTLEKLGIFRYLDLLLHLPHRYQDRTKIIPLSEVHDGSECLVAGQVLHCGVTFGRQRSLKVSIDDGTGIIFLRFFHFSKFQQAQLEKASYIRAYGTFRHFGRELSCAHPEYECFADKPPEPTPVQTPVYPTTQGLGQARLRSLLNTLCSLDWPDVAGTPFGKLKFLHQPPASASIEDIHHVQEDIALDELTAYYLVMKGRALKRQSQRALALPRGAGLGRMLLGHLGFQLTKAQARVVREILQDLEKAVPMLRLVQGDVGSGKTIVAAFAAIRAAEQGGQTALMAPTELLAEQHYLNFSEWLGRLGINTALLTGQMSAKQQNARLEEVASGEATVVIGTHALFQEKVIFNNLALSIIDEQHRFGVHQRMALQNKSGVTHQPHQLVMTATPIPRTLTMALYADMDVSVIDELPRGRQPITTHTVEAQNRSRVVERTNKIIAAGQQAYWVCTLIDKSDEIDAAAATDVFSELTELLPNRRIALLHGRMKSEDKVAVMQAFKGHEIDLLVATTVVEVGVDVPSATHMIIENADRLGLAQLHQLRGRVGRGSQASHCFLVFNRGVSQAAKVRLNAMRESQDGFYLAEQDLKLRGPGDILGTRQAGEQSFRIADLNSHAHLMPQVIARGEALISIHASSDEKLLMRNLLNAWAPADSGHLSV